MVKKSPISAEHWGTLSRKNLVYILHCALLKKDLKISVSFSKSFFSTLFSTSFLFSINFPNYVVTIVKHISEYGSSFQFYTENVWNQVLCCFSSLLSSSSNNCHTRSDVMISLQYEELNDCDGFFTIFVVKFADLDPFRTHELVDYRFWHYSFRVPEIAMLYLLRLSSFFVIVILSMKSQVDGAM